MSFGIIYKATNKINGKVYIGKTVRGLHNRRLSHYSECKANRYKSAFHAAIKKYGKGNFGWKILEYCDSKEELDEMEFHYIKQYNSFGTGGYNLTLGGEGVANFSHTENTKRKMSKRQVGASNSFFGKKHTKESIEKIRKSSIQRKHTLEYRESITGIGNYFYGKTHTQEIKNKVAESNRNRVWTEESKKKLSEARKLYWARKRRGF